MWVSFSRAAAVPSSRLGNFRVMINDAGIYGRAAAKVAAGLRPAVEDGILPPGFAFGDYGREPAGQDARLYGRPEARRYEPIRPHKSRTGFPTVYSSSIFAAFPETM
jgi:hypothetical protein